MRHRSSTAMGAGAEAVGALRRGAGADRSGGDAARTRGNDLPVFPVLLAEAQQAGGASMLAAQGTGGGMVRHLCRRAARPLPRPCPPGLADMEQVGMLHSASVFIATTSPFR